MTWFASRVPTDWAPDPDALLAHARHVAAATRRALAAQGIDDGFVATVDGRGDYHRLSEERADLLLRGSISPRPLHKVLTLIAALREECDDRFAAHEELALAKALVAAIGNLQFGPEVGVGPTKVDAAVVAPWLAEVEAMVDDLRDLRAAGLAGVPAGVIRGNARRLPDALAPGSIDAVICSPPYPNEKDYTRTTRLESVPLGFIGSKAELRAVKRGLVRSNTRTVSKGDDDRHLAERPEIERIAREIEVRRLALGKTSGFERQYHRVARHYFAGMARHLAELRPLLRPGARLAYVVGDQVSYLRVMIRTGRLLAGIGEGLGYGVAGMDLFRTRLATATGEQLREEVVVLRWPGWPASITSGLRPNAAAIRRYRRCSRSWSSIRRSRGC